MRQDARHPASRGRLLSRGPSPAIFAQIARPPESALAYLLAACMGQTHVHRWTDDLMRRIEEGQIDPSFVITHTVGLDAGPEMYKVFRDKQDACIKVVMKP